MMGHGSIYTLSIVSIFHLKDGQNFANFFKSFLAAEFMRHTLIPIIKTGREWTFLTPTISADEAVVSYVHLFFYIGCPKKIVFWHFQYHQNYLR